MNPRKRFMPISLLSLLIVGLLMSDMGAAEQGLQVRQLFWHGNELYNLGDYRQALQVYDQIAATAGLSGALLYNMGNCYAQLGQTGKAVLEYERALRFAPHDSDVRGNLDLIRKNQGLFQDEPPLRQRLFSILDLDQWTLLAGLSLALFTLICGVGLCMKNGRRLRSILGKASLLMLLIAATGAFFQYRQLEAAVVTAEDARLLISPFATAASVGTIQEGRVVLRLSRHGDYCLVEDQAGRSGWIDSRTIELIGGPDSTTAAFVGH